jgi:hypothetical protein
VLPHVTVIALCNIYIVKYIKKLYNFIYIYIYVFMVITVTDAVICLA